MLACLIVGINSNVFWSSLCVSVLHELIYELKHSKSIFGCKLLLERLVIRMNELKEYMVQLCILTEDEKVYEVYVQANKSLLKSVQERIPGTWSLRVIDHTAVNLPHSIILYEDILHVTQSDIRLQISDDSTTLLDIGKLFNHPHPIYSSVKLIFAALSHQPSHTDEDREEQAIKLDT